MPSDETTQSSAEPTPDGATGPSSHQSESPVRRTRRRAASRPAGPPEASSAPPDQTPPSAARGADHRPVAESAPASAGSAAAPPAAKKASSRRSSKKAAAAPPPESRRSATTPAHGGGVCPGTGQAAAPANGRAKPAGREPVRGRLRPMTHHQPDQRPATSGAAGRVLSRLPGTGSAGRRPGPSPIRRRRTALRTPARRPTVDDSTSDSGGGDSGEPERLVVDILAAAEVARRAQPAQAVGCRRARTPPRARPRLRTRWRQRSLPTHSADPPGNQPAAAKASTKQPSQQADSDRKQTASKQTTSKKSASKTAAEQPPGRRRVIRRPVGPGHGAQGLRRGGHLVVVASAPSSSP